MIIFYVAKFILGERVMVWRKTWTERAVEHGNDCEAEVLEHTSPSNSAIDANSLSRYRIKYLIDNSQHDVRADVLIKVC